MAEIYLTYEEACAAACIGCKRGDRLAKGRLHDDGRTRYVTDSDNEHEDHYYPCTAPTREQWVAGLAYEVRLLRRLLHVVDETVIAKVVDERNALRDEVSGLRENIASVAAQLIHDDSIESMTDDQLYYAISEAVGNARAELAERTMERDELQRQIDLMDEHNAPGKESDR